MRKNNSLPLKTVEKMIKDRKIRTAITKSSHFWFFHFYLAHYVKYQTAPFQKEIFNLTENQDIKNIFIVAFRGSAKSTIMNMSYPIWAILGKQQKKFVLILCQTQNQAKQHMMNLRRELESNQLLKNDLGPFKEESDEWGSVSIVFSNFDARISIASSEQSIRGLRHNQYRPDLIIGDDVEDLASTKTREGREKTYQWLKGEVIPTGDRDTRLVIIGNLLHEDSLLMRLKRDLEEGSMDGIFKSYPLLDENNNILWPGKYPDMQAILEEKKRVGNEIAWQREFLLNIIPADEQIVLQEHIHYYDELPKGDDRITIIGIDPAVSEKDAADNTAIVTGVICGWEKNFKVYILPNIVNRKMRFTEIITQIKSLHDSLDKTYNRVDISVEDVSTQRYIIQQLENDHYPVTGVKATSDKRSRLVTVSNLIQTGVFLFPRSGVEQLIQQLLGFGVERYDDLVDAFTIVAHRVIQEDQSGPAIYVIDLETGEMESSRD